MDIPKPIIDLQNLNIKNYRRVWLPFMKTYDCQTICELGVLEGTNFEFMIAHSPKTAIAVDAWIDDGNIARNDSGFNQEILNSQYKNFKKKFEDFPFVKTFREYTFNASKYFPDEYFDLIYVDADHTYEGCLMDLQNWYPKIKKGKFFIGDDYRNGYTSKTKVKIGVKKAVHDFSKKNNLAYYELPNHGWAIIKNNE